ncbi:hypothetical protein F7P69_20335 [Cellulosimicrobium funkei]|nr:hypothetical protein [Cellulosimicrobium funkei]
MNDLIPPINPVQWYLTLGVVMTIAGLVRLLLVRDLVARLIALNVMGVGSLVILVSLAARSQPVDPVLTALVITGLVITVAFTGVGAVLIRRIEGTDPDEAESAGSSRRGPADPSEGGGDR